MEIRKIKKGISRNKKGITLVALVVTIIVLLILAGVSLKLISGSDGIISKSSNAVNETVKASAEEELNLLVSEYQTDYYYDKYAEGNSVGTLAEYIASKMGSGKNADRGTITISGTTLTYTSTDGETVLATLEINNVGTSNGGETPGGTPPGIAKYTINFTAENGTVSQSSIANVPDGAIINVSGESITITKDEETIGTVTAQATPETGFNTTFSSWSCTDGQTITGEITITATYTKTASNLSGQALSIGQEVTVGGEQFFVMIASSASEENVTLLAKYNLNTAGTAQQNAAYGTTACVFSPSNTKYWSTGQADINTSKDDCVSGSAQAKCISYGSSKGGTGKLLTKAQAETLQSQNTNILYGRNYSSGATTNGYLNYWLGTGNSSNSDYVYFVYGNYSNIRYTYYDNSSSRGVRPVLVISKSLVR